MDDDLLFGGQHRFSPDRQWAGSPPSCSQQDDGYRITWGPSMNSVLASCRVNALQPANKLKSSSLLANVKRSSASAGFASPTRPQASTSNLNARNNPNTSLQSASDTSGDTSGGSLSSASTTSRVSKRRRRFLPSSSTPALDFDVSARNNTSHGVRSHSVDDTTSDVTEMLGELARRLEANRNAVAEKENHARIPLANKENVVPTRGSADSNNAKGKQREKVAISPAFSTVIEESMSQGMAGMLVNSTKSATSQRATQSIVGSRERHSAKGDDSVQPLEKPVVDPSTRSTLGDSGYTSRGQKDTGYKENTHRPCSPDTAVKQTHKRSTFMQKACSANAVFKETESRSPQKPAKPVSAAWQEEAPPTLDLRLQPEEDLWDEDDKSLEMAMSQMDIPDAPSSQQGGRSQSNSMLKLPVPPARMRHSSNETEEKRWEGFKARDKRTREKSSDSSSSSVGKLSSKPLVMSQGRIHRPAQESVTPAPVTPLAAPVIKVEPVRNFTKSTSASSDKLKIRSARPMMASARSCGSNIMGAQGLAKKFKCPTVTNTAAARAEQEKKAAAAAKLVKKAGQPLPADETWMEDVDWNVDDSF